MKETIVGDTLQHLNALMDIERKKLFFVSRLCEKDYDPQTLLNAIIDTVINDNITDAAILYPEPSTQEKYINPRATKEIQTISKGIEALGIDLRLHLVSMHPEDFSNAMRKRRDSGGHHARDTRRHR